jgi:hypothetical protein
MSSTESLQRYERIVVAREADPEEDSEYDVFEAEGQLYEEIEVYNWVNVEQRSAVRGHNPVVEYFDADIGAGDSPETPDAVTHWVAEELDFEHNIDLSDHGIEVIDPTDDEVSVL